jgi:hypothetical protein
MPSQQLYAVNTTTSIEDNLLAPVKDPLWFLAMQWRTGEFEAENGGTPARVEVSAVEHPLVDITRGGRRADLDLDAPLEHQIEREEDDGTSPAWRSAALAYDVEVATARQRLRAADYPGDRLDWYHFDLVEARPSQEHDGPRETTRELLPTTLRVRGAPDPRWWRFETADDEPIAPVDPEPNVLSTLLPEFVFIDGNNWYVIPLPQRAGTVREVTGVRVTDTFGIETSLGPAITSWRRGAWGVFVLAGDDDAVAEADGRLLFVPNVALDVLHNDDVEEVRFVRDEEANLVWAHERLYLDADGRPVHNGDAPRHDGDDEADHAEAGGDEADRGEVGPRYVLADAVPPWWVPYVPRFRRPDDATDGEIYLRRARTVEDVDAGPQHQTRIVAESWRLDEHEVPRTGARVRRIRRYARGSDGEGYHWVGRSRQTGQRTAHPERRYDYLEGS